MPKYKIFIDTNVWFSALLGSKNCSSLIEKHITREVMGVVSQKVINELVKNTALKNPRSIPTMKKFLETKPPKIVKIPEKLDKEIMRNVDLKDQLIFQAAVNSKVDLFVTGNLKHFKVKELERKYKIKILSPTEALKYI